MAGSWSWSADNHCRPRKRRRRKRGEVLGWTVHSCSVRQRERESERAREGGRDDVNVPVCLEVGAFRSGRQATERKAGGRRGCTAPTDTSGWTRDRLGSGPTRTASRPGDSRVAGVPLQQLQQLGGFSLWAARLAPSCSSAQWAGPTAATCARDRIAYRWTSPPPLWKATRPPPRPSPSSSW